jgi:hypothetical protein
MRRVFALLAVCWAMGVNTQLLTSVSSGVGDDSVTFNCGGTFEETNAVRKSYPLKETFTY